MAAAPSGPPDGAGRTLFEKVWQQHLIESSVHGASLVAVDRVFLHERTGAIALQGLAARGRAVKDPARVFCTMDHILDTTPGRGDATQVPGGEAFITATRAGARAAGIHLFDVGDPDQGIVHVIAPELGLTLPGATVVCPDSHTCTQGALGALAWGIGSTQAEHALATGTLWVRKPRSLRVSVDGTLAAGVTAKDLCLALISRHGAAGGQGDVIEFAGTAVSALGVEARLTLCNMATEFAAMTALIAPDDTTLEYLAGRRFAPRAGAEWDRAERAWRLLHSDPDAGYDREIRVDARTLAPMITWGTSPEQATPVDGHVPPPPAGAARDGYDRALAYMGLVPGTPLEGLPIDAAFIGSCTNSRITDLRRAARVLEGRRVAPGVRAICVPGSSAVRRQAIAEGLDRVFLGAGFEWRESGCSMCFYAGGESFGHRQRVVSSTNRNFESRQGPEVRTHLASPETVAASALAGCIADVRRHGTGAP